MNLRVRQKVDLTPCLRLRPCALGRIAACRQRRLLVRYSGTEPLLRVMLEGQDQTAIRQWGQEIIDTVKEHLG